MGIQTVNSSKEMSSVTHDMKSVNNIPYFNNIGFMSKYSCFFTTQQRETYQARIEEMEIQSVNSSKDMKSVNMLFVFQT